MARAVNRVWGGLARIARPFANRTLSTAALIEFTQSVRFFLSSGMTLRDTMRALAENGTRPARRAATAIGRDLAAGYGFPESLSRQGRKFPPLFRAMASVGDETGNLPEVMHDLEKYYDFQQQLQRQLRSQISWPVIQFTLALLVVTGLIYMLGQIPQTRPPVRLEAQTPEAVEKLKTAMKAPTLDPLGLGVGEDGAIRFLTLVVGTIAAAAVTFWVIRRLLRRRAFVERGLLWAPFLGPCLEAVALSRFCLAMKLMLKTSMSILDTIRLGYESTDNLAFVAAAPKSVGLLRRGNSVTTAMGATGLFPRRFMSSVAIGEESGHLAETLENQGAYYDDVARQRLALFNRLLATAVWLVVAGFVVVLIFRVFTGAYLKTIDAYSA
ncbi:type II secretion system F family protein [Limnoglobus roseus]|uniref:General secretion pathway protein GspF n=1 Tax=Limnoglobus roseus TaxID=2598579 RepID=A0A5C1AK20_9BACT|nr:type II secretion system F family protein [Limnoglobus roseus]QEL18366.1 general secretion pathway protein GspF [Limnoglobus roseus]